MGEVGKVEQVSECRGAARAFPLPSRLVSSADASPQLGHATSEEMQDAITYEHYTTHALPSLDPGQSSPHARTLGSRRKSVVFAAPTYVDHPGVTWSDASSCSDDDENEDDAGLIESELTVMDEDGEVDAEETIMSRQVTSVTTPPPQTAHQSYAAHVETTPTVEDPPTEPDDGIAWSDAAARESQMRIVEHAVEGRDSPSGRYGALGVARGPSTGVARPETPREEPRGEEAVKNDVHPADIIDRMRLSPLENQRASPSLRSVSTASQVSSASYASTARSDSASPDLDGRKRKEGTAKKKRSGVFSGLFKKRDKARPTAAAAAAVDEDKARGSDESFVNRSQSAAQGPTGSPLAASDHQPMRVQPMDQHQRYHEYVARSGTIDSAIKLTDSTFSSRLGVSDSGSFSTGRPGSIIVHPSVHAFGELTVLRVFAGETVESENTFKTVLTNEETNAKRLVQQAVQRLQLPSNEDYYLVIKEADGEQVELADDEKVLEKFFAMSAQYDDDQAVNRIRRSSIGSISSIASNLSQHPVIRKFASNDYSDDSSVKLFLHRRSRPPPADTSTDSIPTTPTRAKPFPYLSVGTDADGSPASSAGSPTARFSMQVAVSSADLPEGMGLDPETEVARIVKRGSSESGTSHKLLLVPRNAMVAEVIEAGLERFGISGVVAGGDDVEDKISKRRSMMRVRYGLVARVGDEEGTSLISRHNRRSFPLSPASAKLSRLGRVSGAACLQVQPNEQGDAPSVTRVSRSRAGRHPADGSRVRSSARDGESAGLAKGCAG